jgi:PqqD family protein of HPr-rel-A system
VILVKQRPMRFALVEGLELAPVGQVWAAFSPASGQTTLINNESAAILECLRDGPADAAAVSAALALDCALPAAQVAATLEAHWPSLIAAGLLRRQTSRGRPPA